MTGLLEAGLTLGQEPAPLGRAVGPSGGQDQRTESTGVSQAPLTSPHEEAAGALALPINPLSFPLFLSPVYTIYI